MTDADSALETGQAGEGTAVAESAPVETNKTEGDKALSRAEAFDKAWSDLSAAEAGDKPADGEAGAKDKPTDTTTPAKGQEGAEAAKTTTDPAGPTAAPEDWSAAEKQAYGRLPKEAQTQVMRLYKSFQAGFTRKSQELSEQAKFATTVQEITKPFAADLQQAGIDAAEGIRRLTQLHGWAKSDPVAYAKWFLQQSGVTAEQLGFAPQQGQAQQGGQQAATGYVDPEIAKVQQDAVEAKQLAQRLFKVREDEVKASVAREIQEFRNAKSGDGQPLYPHYDAVKDGMASLIRVAAQSGRVLSLADAYEQAMWSNPQLRQAALDAKTREAVEAERKAAAEAAAKARTAGRNLQSRPAPQGSGGRMTRAKAFDAAWNDLNSR